MERVGRMTMNSFSEFCNGPGIKFSCSTLSERLETDGVSDIALVRLLL